MKRVAFLSFDWDHVIMSAYYEGMQSCVEERDDTALFIFSAYGEHEGPEAGEWALDLFALCDPSRFDGFLVQGNRTWPPEQRQRFVDGIRALGKPVVSLSYDQSIRDTAEVITCASRGENVFAMRYGGDEFLLICRRNLIPRLEEELAALKRRYDRPYDLELSMGASLVTEDERLTLDEAIERADACMYEVKKARKTARARQ